MLLSLRSLVENAEITGVGDLTSGAPALDAVATQGFEATSSVIAPAGAFDATGAETFTATAAIAAPAPAIAGTAAETFASSASLVAPAAALDAVASEQFIATGSLLAPAAAVASQGVETFVGSAAVAAPAGAVASEALQGYLADADVVIAAPALSSEGAEQFAASATLVAPSSLIDAVGESEADESFRFGDAAVTSPVGAVSASGDVGEAPALIEAYAAAARRRPLPPPRTAITGEAHISSPQTRIAARGVMTPMAIIGLASMAARTHAVVSDGYAQPVITGLSVVESAAVETKATGSVERRRVEPQTPLRDIAAEDDLFILSEAA